MYTRFLTLVPLFVLGCTTNDAAGPGSSSEPVPHVSGDFQGSYVVPEADPSLAAAAVFAVDHVEWVVANGVATLHYDLPVGLVGGDLDVTLSGPIEPGQTVVELSSSDGVGTCTTVGTSVSCREVFSGLGALPQSPALVVERATVEYAGAPQDRVDVANTFASDPIGVVHFDVASPALEPGED